MVLSKSFACMPHEDEEEEDREKRLEEDRSIGGRAAQFANQNQIIKSSPFLSLSSRKKKELTAYK